jgi:hypothetical protein
MQQTLSRLLRITNTGQGTLVITLNCPMRHPITLTVNVLRGTGDMGEYMALVVHDSDQWRN